MDCAENVVENRPMERLDILQAEAGTMTDHVEKWCDSFERSLES